MIFILDPIFHTKTMIKVLKDQGYLRYAEKICQEILVKNPLDTDIENLLKGIQIVSSPPLLKPENGDPDIDSRSQSSPKAGMTN